MARFLDSAAHGSAVIDTSCVKKVLPPPFFLSLNGPGP
jgi:hypothetical protein